MLLNVIMWLDLYYRNSTLLPKDCTMAHQENAREPHGSVEVSDLGRRTAVLSSLARIIANAHLSKNAADKNGAAETTPTNAHHPINDGVSQQ